MNLSRIVLLLMLAAGCAAEMEPEATTQPISAATVTIKGRVFFNDRRDHGLFSARRTLSGAVGTKCGTSGASCTVNWLAGQYMVVDVIERDTGFAPTDWNCKAEDVLSSVAVAYDGSFTATFTPSDGCNHDELASFAIALKVRLRYCGDWCISVGPDEDAPYSLYYPGAGYAAPLIVTAGQTRVLGDMAFQPAGTSATDPNDHAVAANLYASLVDTALTVHRDSGVPFYADDFGELAYVYPSSATSTATTKSATKVVHRKASEWETGANGWTRGSTPAHEYGHVLMLRAWDGDYGFEGVGISANDTERAPSRQIAFKEAWAEYVSHAVMVETRACDAASFDDNATTPLPGPLGDGTTWRLNVTKALCDWADARNDDDAALDGTGDHFAASGLYSMWFNLREMYLRADEYGGDYAGEGLWFCDYVDYYLGVRNPGSVDSITDLVYNNNIACYL
jgi:hypothetical protein